MQSVRGTHDLVFSSSKRFRYVLDVYTQVARRFGFQEIKTPIFEFTQVFARTLGDASDIVSKEMYSFTDKGGDSLSLRPEGTAGIVRSYIEQKLQHQWPLKFFYEGPMFRYERPQKGRYRQFYQIGAELLGVENPQADIETISLAQLLLINLNIAQKCTLEINSIGDKESRDIYRTKLVEYYKKHEGALSEDSKKRLTVNPLRILDSKDQGDIKINAGAPHLLDYLNASSAEKFALVQKGLSALKIPFKINPHLVRGLDYYCHLVFEFRTSELGSQDAVLSGGRYDGLSEAMGGPKTAAIGWAAGVERLCLLLPEDPKNEVTFSLIPIGEAAELYCLKLAQDLRSQGLYIDMSYSGNLSNRMKKAATRESRAVVIIGDAELAAREFGLKILSTGEQVKIKEAELEAKLFDLSRQ